MASSKKTKPTLVELSEKHELTKEELSSVDSQIEAAKLELDSLYYQRRQLVLEQQRTQELMRPLIYSNAPVDYPMAACQKTGF